MKNIQSFDEFINESKINIEQIYWDDFSVKFTEKSNIKEIEGWKLDENTARNYKRMRWLKDGYELLAYPYIDNKESIYIYVEKMNGPGIIIKKQIPLKYTGNIVEDINSYIKVLEKFTKAIKLK